MRVLALTLLLLVLKQSPECHARFCHEVFQVGRSSGRVSGIFISDNFPHAVPVRSSCSYEFRVSPMTRSDILCLSFRELSLFTNQEEAMDESTIELWNEQEKLLIYSGNGSLVKQLGYWMVVNRTDNLLSGPLCLLTPSFQSQYTLKVKVNDFSRNTVGRVTRFLAEYAAIGSSDLGKVTNFSKSDNISQLHRCLDGTYISESKRCNSVIDCTSRGGLYNSDYFSRSSSDESYEHARCSSTSSFGTNFLLGQANAHRAGVGSDVTLDCSNDHSDHFHSRDPRNCALRIPRRPSNIDEQWSMLKLNGIEFTASLKSACYRFYWQSSGFPSSDESLAFTEPNGGRTLLRLEGREYNQYWHMLELQVDSRSPAVRAGRIDVFSLRPDHRTGSSAQHWLDDLSAEPVPCSESTFESHMPAVCSFEWSTCGWTSTAPIVTDSSIANEYRVSFSDHTSDSVPGRIVPSQPQHVLKLVPGTNESQRLTSVRRMIHVSGDKWCLGLWFYGLGDEGYSARLEVNVQIVVGTRPTHAMMTATAVTNKWHLLTGSLLQNEYMTGSLNFYMSLQAQSHSNLRLVLLDDVSITTGHCYSYEGLLNGTVQCGSLEWRCLYNPQCIPHYHRCDGRHQCRDGTDESNCGAPAVNRQQLPYISRGDDQVPLDQDVVLAAELLVMIVLIHLYVRFRRPAIAPAGGQLQNILHV